MRQKILIAAGGTGGHIFPALAVAGELKQQGFDISWLGTEKGLEAKLVPEHGYKLYFSSVRGLRGKSHFQTIVNFLYLFKSIIQTILLFIVIKPKLVLAMGGYAAGPAGIVAKLFRVPLVLHEQNKVICFTNKILSRFSDKILESFKDTYKGAIYTGNPVRREIMQLGNPRQRYAKRDRTKLRVLILGGSLGAATINFNLPEILNQLKKEVDLSIWHQAGKTSFYNTKELYLNLEIEAKVEDFIGDMQEAYAFADVVIARAGATTVAELCAVGIASILIPYPYATDEHQRKNAQEMVSAKAAYMVMEEQLNTKRLHEIILYMAHHPEHCIQMAENAKNLARFNATEKVISECLEYID